MAVVSFGVFSSSVGIGALPTSTLPVYGVTNGDGSRATVAELGDVNGDGIGDYAVGPRRTRTPARAWSTCSSGMRAHSRRRRPRWTSARPRSRSPATAARCSGIAIAGDDVNGDGLNDIAIGAPAAGAPSKADGGAVYVAFGSPHPQSLASTQLYPTGYTNDPGAPATPSPFGSRYDSFGVSAHTGMALAALPDVNGDGYRDIAVGSPDTSIHRPGEGNVAVLYGKPHGEHINLSDLWEDGYPYYFHIDFPALDNQHVGESVASVRDMTGDGWPDLAIGAPQADPNGRVDSGSVWIISGHLPPIDAGCSMHMVDNSCPWIRLKDLTAAQGYRIDGAAAGDGSAPRWQASATRTATASPTSRSASRRHRPPDARARARSSSCRASAALTVRDLATAPPLQRFSAPRPAPASARRSRPRATSTATATSTCSPALRASRDSRARVLPARRAGRDVDLAGAAEHRAGGRGRADGERGRRGLLAGRRRRGRPGLGAGHGGAFVVGGSDPPPSPAQPAPPPRRDAVPHRRADAARGKAGGTQEEAEEAAALPAQEAEAEVPHRQGQAREGEAEAVPPCRQQRARPRRRPSKAKAQGEGQGEGQGQVARPRSRSRLESAACPRTPTTALRIPPSATRRS